MNETARERYKAAYRTIRLFTGKISDVDFRHWRERQHEAEKVIGCMYGIIGLRAVRSWWHMDRRNYKWENLHNRLGLAARDKAFYKKFPSLQMDKDVPFDPPYTVFPAVEVKNSQLEVK